MSKLIDVKNSVSAEDVNKIFEIKHLLDFIANAHLLCLEVFAMIVAQEFWVICRMFVALICSVTQILFV